MTNIYDRRPWLKYYSPWIPPDLDIPKINLVQVFQQTVSRYANRPAIYYFGRSISYAEVDRWSDALAAALQEMGLRKSREKNSPEYLIPGHEPSLLVTGA
jgi:long-chain acyl-CoA synthetase